MQTKRILLGLFFCALISLMVFNPGTAVAKSMTLKVSHQFSAGDVRDQMARVFGDMVTKTQQSIVYRHQAASGNRSAG